MKAEKNLSLTLIIVLLITALNVKAATWVSGYSTTLNPNPLTNGTDSVLFFNGAVTSGGDTSQNANGEPGFSVQIKNIWHVGDVVTLTGIAMVQRVGTASGTFTIDFYDLNGGATPNAFDGIANETKIGTATVTLVADITTTGPYYAIFDTPITFTSASTGIAVHWVNSAAIRCKVNNAPASQGIIRVNTTTGAPIGGANPRFGMSLAGTAINPLDRTWYGGIDGNWDTTTLNWKDDNSDLTNYSNGDLLTFDDSSASVSPATITLASDYSPDKLTVNNSVINYIFTGGSIIGDTGLLKDGIASLTLDNTNAYTGNTSISGGTLQVGMTGAIPAGPGAGDVSIANGATLDVNGMSERINGLTGAGTVDNTATAAAVLTVGIDKTNVTFGGTLQNSGGSLTFVKNGTNTLTLTGTSSHSGSTIIQEGELLLKNPGYFSYSSPLVASNGASLGLDVSGGFGSFPTSVSLNDATVTVAYGNLYGSSPYVTALSDAGALTINGTNNIVLTGTNLGLGIYTIISYGSIDGSGSFNPNPILPLGVFGRVETNGNSIVVNITSQVQQLTWSGMTGSDWTTANNWNYGSATYMDYGPYGDVVTFDDTLDGTALNTNVNMSVAVQPFAMTVNNNTYDYSFGGSGKITGLTSLIKKGVAALTLNTANDFAGGSSLQSGMVRLGNDAGLGTGTIALAGGGISSAGGTPRTVTNAMSITAASALGDSNHPGQLMFAGPVDLNGSAADVAVSSDVVFSGTYTNGSFREKSGSGNLIFTGTGYQGGTLEIGEGNIVVDGGVISGGSVRISCQPSNDIARLIVTNGGSVTVTSGNARIGSGPEFPGDPSSTNELDLSGTIDIAGSVQIGANSAFDRVNMYPDSVFKLQGFSYMGTAVAEVNVNKGTFVAKTNKSAFFPPHMTVNIQASGLTMDSAGFVVGIPVGLSDGGGGGGLTKTGAGALNLNGTNTYTGATLINAGALGGTGSIAGPVMVGANGTLSPGDSTVGTLTISNNLTLAGDIVIEVDKSLSQSNDTVNVSGAVVYGGTLMATNIGAISLVAGDNFQIFPPGGTGNFTLAGSPGDGLIWSFDPASGKLSVTSQASGAPAINPPVLSGGNLILTGTNNVTGGTYSVLTSTNITAPFSSWTTNATGVFNPDGTFSNAIPVENMLPAQFFMIKLP